LRKGDFKKAVGRYKESYTYAEKMKKGNLDKRLFSHVGLLTAYSFMKEKDHIQKEVKEWGSRFVKIISEIPEKDAPINKRWFPMLKSQKIKFAPFYDQRPTKEEDILDIWKKHFKGDWITELDKLVKPD